MAALNLIVMIVSALWFLAYLDRHTNRDAKARRQSPSSKTPSSDNPHQ
jgi:hypothetical protein